jgi:hypothetical protein
MTAGDVQRVLDGYPHGGTRKLILIGIANHDGEGGSWPAIETLASYAGVTRRNAQKAIRVLEAEGVLTVEANGGGHRNTRADQRSNLYVIDYDSLGDGVSVATPRTERGVAGDPNGVSLGSQRGVATDARTPQNKNRTPLPLAGLPPIPDREGPDGGPYALRIIAEQRFEKWWEAYPKRDGKRVGRGKSHKIWMSLTPEDHVAAWNGVRNYARSGWRPKDPERWLRDRCWEEWQEAAVPDGPTGNGTQAVGYTGQGHSWA